MGSPNSKSLLQTSMSSDPENHWARLSSRILSSEHMPIFVKMLRRCWADVASRGARDRLVEVVRRGNPAVSTYTALTDQMAVQGISWDQIGAFRASVVDMATTLLVSHMILNDKLDRKNIKGLGSSKKYSDYDITITHSEPDMAAFALIFFFGAIWRKVTDETFHFANIAQVSIESTIRSYLEGFRHSLDVNVYSSNGVIASMNGMSNQCTLIDRLVSEVSPHVLQIIHQDHRCQEQASLYVGVCVLLVRRIYKIIKDRALLSDRHLEVFSAKMTLVEKSIETHQGISMSLFLKEAKIYEAERCSIKLLKLQLYSSHLASVYGHEIANGDCKKSNFCSLATEWEMHQVLANLVSPDSAVAVQTFLVTVLEGQGGFNVNMYHDDYYVAYVENLLNMLNYINPDTLDVRKAYKYATRMQSCAQKISGVDYFKSDAVHLEDDVEQRLRDSAEQDDVIIMSRLTLLAMAACQNIFNLAPIHLLHAFGMQSYEHH